MGKAFLSLLLFFFFEFSPCFAQSLSSTFEEDVMRTSIQDIGILSGTTLLGVVMGLSTLSFVEDPHDHLDRILLGGSLGIIVGVGVVIYFQATRSKQIYEQSSFSPKELFLGPALESSRPRFVKTKIPFPLLQHRFTF